MSGVERVRAGLAGVSDPVAVVAATGMMRDKVASGMMRPPTRWAFDRLASTTHMTESGTTTVSANRKGDRRERELVNALDGAGFAVMRAPASGAATESGNSRTCSPATARRSTRSRQSRARATRSTSPARRWRRCSSSRETSARSADRGPIRPRGLVLLPPGRPGTPPTRGRTGSKRESAGRRYRLPRVRWRYREGDARRGGHRWHRHRGRARSRNGGAPGNSGGGSRRAHAGRGRARRAVTLSQVGTPRLRTTRLSPSRRRMSR